MVTVSLSFSLDELTGVLKIDMEHFDEEEKYKQNSKQDSHKNKALNFLKQWLTFQRSFELKQPTPDSVCD